ncbi:peptidase S10 serine carboxypeptidase [Rhizoctonia solani]|nr:peptidase S10 serine carboxypeptidase [Rhizoctonia solani]
MKRLTMGLTKLALISLALSCHSLGSVIFQSAAPLSFEPEIGEVQFEQFSHPALPESKLRIKSPKLCDPSVKQYSGYFDISEDKHIFFWFFEARNNPRSAPVAIWLNGGPGCSSNTGLLMELGPCTIGENGMSTTINRWSWNTDVNMLFIDQPAGVGYSYNTGPIITSSFDAAADMWVLLQLFYRRFGEYAGELHIAGESYAGVYIPYIARTIWENNKKVGEYGGDLLSINLTSIMIGAGLTHPWYQFGATYNWLCGGEKWQVWGKNSTECKELARDEATCVRMIEYCDKLNTDLICGAVALFCLEEMMDMINQSGLNPLDGRSYCDARNGSVSCYPESGWISDYLNRPDIKRELGVDPNVDFRVCDNNTNQAFIKSGDPVRNAAVLLPEVIEGGLRMLNYAGDADLLSAFPGMVLWLENLNTTYQQKFIKSPRMNFLSENNIAGYIRTTSDGHDAGQIALMHIYEAGHLAPHDQPRTTLDMFNRWIFNLPLATGK